MICKNCGKEINDSHNVCEYCGAVQEETAINREMSFEKPETAEKKKGNSMTKVIIALAVVAVILVGAVIGVSTIGRDDNKTTTAAVTTANVTQNAVPQLTDSQAEKMFDDLIVKITGAATKDEAEQYYIHDNGYDISSSIDFLSKSGNYSKHMSCLAAKTNDSYMVYRCDYTITVDNNNTHRDSNQYYGVIKYDGNDKTWKLDCSDSINNDFDNTEIGKAYNQVFYSRFDEDVKSLDNFVAMNSNWYFICKPDAYYEGISESTIIAAYQKKDGSVDVVIHINNGKAQRRQVKKFVIKITDDKLGTVVDKTVNPNKVIGANSGENYVVTISSKDVKTGTQKWGSISTSLDYTDSNAN